MHAADLLLLRWLSSGSGRRIHFSSPPIQEYRGSFSIDNFGVSHMLHLRSGQSQIFAPIALTGAMNGTQIRVASSRLMQVRDG